ILLALSTFVPLPRFTVLGFDGAFGSVPLPRPGVIVLSLTVIVPAVIVLFAAHDIVTVSPAPLPPADSFPPFAGIVPAPVVNEKLANPLMSTVPVSALELVLVLPTPARKLELFVPPLMTSDPAPETTSLVVIACETFGLPTINAPLTVEFSPLSAELLTTF